MPADPRLLNHPAVRAEAKRLARELWSVQAPLFEAAGWDTAHDPDDEDAREGFALTVEGHARLLSDPERDEARDWLVRSGAAANKHRRLTAWAAIVSQLHAFRDDPDRLVPEWLAVMS